LSAARYARAVFCSRSTHVYWSQPAYHSLIANNLVGDGATLQMGIGNIPNAVLSGLTHHKDLGIHTEVSSIRLTESYT
jgi:hypothetical protein